MKRTARFFGVPATLQYVLGSAEADIEDLLGVELDFCVDEVNHNSVADYRIQFAVPPEHGSFRCWYGMSQLYGRSDDLYAIPEWHPMRRGLCAVAWISAHRDDLLTTPDGFLQCGLVTVRSPQECRLAGWSRSASSWQRMFDPFRTVSRFLEIEVNSKRLQCLRSSALLVRLLRAGLGLESSDGYIAVNGGFSSGLSPPYAVAHAHGAGMTSIRGTEDRAARQLATLIARGQLTAETTIPDWLLTERWMAWYSSELAALPVI